DSHRLPEPADGGRAASRLKTEYRILVQLVIGRRSYRRHIVEWRVELLGEDHGESRVDALPHLHLRDREGDFAVLVDANEGVRREIRVRRGGESQGEPWDGDAKYETAARGGCRLHHRAASERARGRGCG